MRVDSHKTPRSLGHRASVGRFEVVMRNAFEAELVSLVLDDPNKRCRNQVRC